jgi:leucyl-tRNA synthetase
MDLESNRRSGRLREGVGLAAREMRKAPTKAEARLWQLLRDRRLGNLKFRRQHAFGRFIVDFYCASAQLVLEMDGPIHEAELLSDVERQKVLEHMGLRILRFTNDEVLEMPEAVLSAILKKTQG